MMQTTNDLETWVYKVSCAADRDLIAFRDANYLGLRDIDNEHWNLCIEIVDEEIRLRKI